MRVVTFACDDYTAGVQAQLTRDLLVLKGSWDISIWDPKNLVPDALLQQLDVERTGSSQVDLCILYKTRDSWPQAPSKCTLVERDLCPADKGPRLDTDPQVGYFLRPQGKGMTNRTEYYLNRAYPKGKGIVNPMLMLLWGASRDA